MSRIDAPRAEWILVAEIPPLVSQEQFERVQARLVSNRRSRSVGLGPVGSPPLGLHRAIVKDQITMAAARRDCPMIGEIMPP
jgi:hypothetical protein